MNRFTMFVVMGFICLIIFFIIMGILEDGREEKRRDNWCIQKGFESHSWSETTKFTCIKTENDTYIEKDVIFERNTKKYLWREND